MSLIAVMRVTATPLPDAYSYCRKRAGCIQPVTHWAGASAWIGESKPSPPIMLQSLLRCARATWRDWPRLHRCRARKLPPCGSLRLARNAIQQLLAARAPPNDKALTPPINSQLNYLLSRCGRCLGLVAKPCSGYNKPREIQHFSG